MFRRLLCCCQTTYKYNVRRLIKLLLHIDLIFYSCEMSELTTQYFNYIKHIPYLLTYSMQQSPSWQANWFSASQEIPHILWNQKVHYRIHHVPATCPYPEPARSSLQLNIPLPEDASLYYPPINDLVCQVVSFPQVSPPKSCISLSSNDTRYMPCPYVLYIAILNILFCGFNLCILWLRYALMFSNHDIWQSFV
jgi:hypothetical protein